MKRREFVRAAALSTGVVGWLNSSTLAADQELPHGFAHSLVAIGWGVFAEPKYCTSGPSASKVPGTMVCLAAARPDNASPYSVAICAQYRRNGEAWRDAPCNPEYGAVYGLHSRLWDAQRLTGETGVVSLFVPDEAHFLRPNNKVEIRMAIRFFRTGNRPINGLERHLPHEVVTPRISGKHRTLEFAERANAPPFDVYDIVKGQIV